MRLFMMLFLVAAVASCGGGHGHHSGSQPVAGQPDPYTYSGSAALQVHPVSFWDQTMTLAMTHDTSGNVSLTYSSAHAGSHQCGLSYDPSHIDALTGSTSTPYGTDPVTGGPKYYSLDMQFDATTDVVSMFWRNDAGSLVAVYQYSVAPTSNG